MSDGTSARKAGDSSVVSEVRVMHALGIDIGTTSISIVLLDEQSGRVIAHETVDHSAFIDDGCPVGRVQDAEKVWNIVSGICERFTKETSAISCIGLTGQMHGMLYVDKDGRAVSPLYTWQDGRANLDMEDGISYVSYLKAKGLSAAAGYGLTTHFYLLKNGLVPVAAAKLTTISDYIAMRLCGNKEPVIGKDMAAGWGCFDPEKQVFKTEEMKQLGFDISLLPKLVSRHEIIGYTKDNVPVVVSVGDNQASVIGSVQDLDDTVLINIGTGSQVSVGIKKYIACEGSVELRPCTGDMNMLVGSGLCGGRAYAMLEQFYREAAGSNETRYDVMLAQAEEFLEKHGSEAAWKVRTTFFGTRNNPEEKGSVCGIGGVNFHPGALTLGVIKGILEELYDFYKQMCSISGKTAKNLVGSGNGLRRNRLMQRMAEEIFGMRLLIPVHQEEAAYGAALCAMAASGRTASLADAQAMIAYIN